jgi:hypothetical protein
MTFFYDLNKRMAELANKQTLAEGKEFKPDFLDMDKDGDRKEPMKQAAKQKGEKVAGSVLAKLRAKEDVSEAEMDESALQAYLGKKKYGEQGMKALQQAGRDGASKQKMASIRAQHDKMDEAEMDEGNEFSGALARAKASGAKEFEVDGKKYQVTSEGFKEMDAYLEKKKKEQGTGKFDKKQISTGTVYTRRHEEEPEDDEDAPASKGGAPKKKGRKEVGAGKGKKIGAKSRGTSKLASKGSIAEDDMIPLVDKGEYDREGDMALNQLHQIEDAAEELHSILDADENLPEWVQSKITKAVDYIDTARDYMKAKKQQYTSRGEIAEPVAEKAVSKQQQKFMGMAHAMQKGEKIKGASPELKTVAKTMKKSDVEDFAATKHKGLPKKVKEADAEPKAAGGIKFGQGVYESINSQVEKMIVEGMNISVNATQNAEGENHKSITVTADGDDADKLAQLLNLAGLPSSDTGCGCGQTPCGCSQVEEAYGDTDPTENNPDYPTDAETTGSDDELLRRWAGGLNKPKSTGQTTVPVIASQVRRQVSMEENVTLERSLFKTWQNYKG